MGYSSAKSERLTRGEGRGWEEKEREGEGTEGEGRGGEGRLTGYKNKRGGGVAERQERVEVCVVYTVNACIYST